MSRGRPIVVAAGAAVAVALLGGSMTETGSWYRDLDKSSLTPPDWAFAPAWTVIYALAAIAAVLGWRGATTNRARAWLISLFFINAVLNVLWSFVFFSMRRPDLALAEVVTLWLSVLSLIVFLWPLRRLAALVLTPYLGWVTFAAWLNWRVVELNPPFGAGP